MPYCIREVEMEWGLPVLEDPNIEHETQPQVYNVFEDYNAAVKYIKLM